MFIFNLSERKNFFSSLNLKGGKISFGGNFYLIQNWVFVDIEYRNFAINIWLSQKHLFKSNVFSVCTKDTATKNWDAFHGQYYKTVKKDCASKKDLLKTIQSHIDYVDRFNRLKAFL